MKKKFITGLILLTLIVSMMNVVSASEELEVGEDIGIDIDESYTEKCQHRNRFRNPIIQHQIALKTINHFMEKFGLTEEDSIGELLNLLRSETNDMKEQGLEKAKEALGLDEDASLEEVKEAHQSWMEENKFLIRFSKGLFGKWF